MGVSVDRRHVFDRWLLRHVTLVPTDHHLRGTLDPTSITKNSHTKTINLRRSGIRCSDDRLDADSDIHMGRLITRAYAFTSEHRNQILAISVVVLGAMTGLLVLSINTDATVVDSLWNSLGRPLFVICVFLLIALNLQKISNRSGFR